MPDSRLVESEERGDDVAEGVAHEGHESTDGHEGRRHHTQDGASQSDAGNGADHHDRNHHYREAHLRRAAGGDRFDALCSSYFQGLSV